MLSSRTIVCIFILLIAFAQALIGQEDAGNDNTAAPSDAEAGQQPREDGEDDADGPRVRLGLDPGRMAVSNIVVEVDDMDADRETSIFAWREKNADSNTNTRIGKLMGEASFQSRIGNLEGAIEVYGKVLEIDPDNKLAKLNRGTALVQSRKYDEALEVLLPLMEEHPRNFMLKNNIAWVYATAENIEVRNGEKALSLARDALLLVPRDYHVWHTLSEAYFVSAQYEKAREMAEIALRMAASGGEDRARLQKLSQQVLKCRQAVATMSIMD